MANALVFPLLKTALYDTVKLNLEMKSPRNTHILFGNQKNLHFFCYESTSKMVQASCRVVCFFKKKTETVTT